MKSIERENDNKEFNKDLVLSQLNIIRDDIRDEIKRRIEQRDNYSIQMTIALSAIVGVAFSQKSLRMVLISAPIVAIYYTILILYSYRQHNLSAKFLRDRIDPEISKLLGMKSSFEWEKYCAEHSKPGLRKGFFILSLWFFCIATPVCLIFLENGVKSVEYAILYMSISLIYISVATWITKTFWND